MSKVHKIPLENLKEWMEEETVSIVEPLHAEATSLLDKLKARLDDLLEACEKLLASAEKEIAKSSRKTYRRAKLMNKLFEHISELIEEVTFPNSISSTTLHTLHKDLGRALSTIEKERMKWFPLISPYFIIDRRRFDVVLKRAGDQFREVDSFLSSKYEKADAVEECFLTITQLLQSLDELSEVQKRKENTDHQKIDLEARLTTNQQRIISIQNKREVITLSQLEKKIGELEDQVQYNLRYLQKPLRKFQSFAEGPGHNIPPNEAKKLEEYLDNPFEALVTEEEGYPILKNLLHGIERAINEKKLKLKSSRLRKAQTQINAILHQNSLSPLYRICLESYSQRESVLQSGAISTTRSEIENMHENQKGLQRRIELVNIKERELNKKIEISLKGISEQKRELEETILELTGRNIEITFPEKITS